MNHLILGFLTFFVISSSFVPTAWSVVASEPSSIDFEFEDKILEPQQVVEKANTYEIHIGKNAVYSIDIAPTEQEINRSLGFEAPEVIQQKIIAEGGTLPEPAKSLEPYNSMSMEQRRKFHQTRIAFLKGLARILHHSQWGLSAGILAQDALSYTFKKALRKEIPVQDKSLVQRRHEFIQNLLTSVNHHLFYQAPLVASKNEFGISGSVGMIALTGVRDKGFGGILEVGFSIGYNQDQKAFIFEFTMTPEKYHHSIAAATVIGVNGKLGPYLSSIPQGKENATVRGSSFYPPMAPGFSSNSPSYAAFGLSSGLGFPPPPLADFLTFSNTFEKYKVLRISVPRFIVTGIPRISVGEVGLLLAVTKGGVMDGYQFLVKRFKSWRSPKTCDGVFATL